MKFAICNETFVDWPFERACAAAREIGYTGIEIAPFTLASDAKLVSAEQRAEVARQAAAAGLEVIGLHWLLAKTEGYYLTSPEKEVRARTAEYFRELARLCGDVGGTLMVLGSPFQRNLLPGVSHDEAMDYAADVLQAAMPECEACGVTIALEPLGPVETNFMNTAASGIELARRIGSPNCKLHLDVKALSTEAAPIPDVIRASRDYLVHFHANDPNKLGPGMGEVRYEPIFGALAEIEYQGWVSVEVFDYSPGPEFIARESLRYMQGLAGQMTNNE